MSRRPMAYVVLAGIGAASIAPANAQQAPTTPNAGTDRMVAIAVCGEQVHRTSSDFGILPARDGSFGVFMPVRSGTRIVRDTCLMDAGGRIIEGQPDGPACGIATRIRQCLAPGS